MTAPSKAFTGLQCYLKDSMAASSTPIPSQRYLHGRSGCLLLTLALSPFESVQSTLTTCFSPAVLTTHPIKAESPTCTLSSGEEVVKSARP